MTKRRKAKSYGLEASATEKPAAIVTEPLRDRWTRVSLILFIVILLFGTLLRVLWLGKASYQIDELATMQMWQSDKSFSDVMDHALRDLHWNHRMPLLPLINHFMMNTFKYAGALPPEWLARLPFALLGVLTLPFMYLIGRAVRNQITGMWCMFLTAFSIFAVFYSREAYDYSLLIFFSAGTLWAGIRLVQTNIANGKIDWPRAAAYMFFSTLLLQTHLCGLLFLAPFNVLMMVVLIRYGGWDKILHGYRPLYWLAAFGTPFVVFSPFLLRLMGGYTSADRAPLVKRFSGEVFPAVFGRMGWGQLPWTLLPFLAFVLVSIIVGVSTLKRNKRWEIVALVALAVAYFAAQSWMLRVSRFEIRYYSPFFPILMVFAAVGIESSVLWISAHAKNRHAGLLRAGVAAVLLLWLAPSLWAVCTLTCRGANYKSVAEWVNRNIPPHGIYSFYNMGEMRAVPSVYPTPGLIPTSVAYWSQEDVKPHLRAESLFTRFPLIYFVTFAADGLLPPKATPPLVPLDRLFLRHEWLEDKAWDTLHRLATAPTGDTQEGATNLHRAFIYYNQPEDLPKLAVSRGKKYYHDYGPEWQFIMDRQMNHWKVASQTATLNIVNLGDKSSRVDVILQAFAPPSGCQCSVYSADGKSLLDRANVAAQFQRLAVTNVVLEPGGNLLTVKVLPSPGQLEGNLLVYDLNTREPQSN